jgi:hypothetical protein
LLSLGSRPSLRRGLGLLWALLAVAAIATVEIAAALALAAVAAIAPVACIGALSALAAAIAAVTAVAAAFRRLSQRRAGEQGGDESRRHKTLHDPTPLKERTPEEVLWRIPC